MENNIRRSWEKYISVLALLSVMVYAQSYEEKKLWEDAEKGYVYGIGHYKDINLNIKNEKGQTPLMIAVQHGHVGTVRGFSEGTVDILVEDFEGKTAYEYITPFTSRENQFLYQRMYGALRILEVTQIVRTKAKIVQYSYDNRTDILQITIKGKDVSCDSFLFPKNTECRDIKVKTIKDHEIFNAIKSKDNTLFDQLLPSVDVEMKDKRNYSLLWRAIISKNLYAVDQLLQQGADINGKDNNNHHTPIMYATINNMEDLLKVLLKHDVDVNSKNQFGNYVLSTAMQGCDNFEVIALLLDNGANPYLKDKRGETVFDKKSSFCKKQKNIDKMKKLLKERSNFNPSEDIE